MRTLKARSSGTTGWLGRMVGRLLRPFRDARGLTLYETTAVVAMTAIMAAVAIPVVMDRIENAKDSKVGNEVLNLGNSMMKFFQDTGRWPGEAEIRSDGTTCFLQSGQPGTDPSKHTLLPDTLGRLGTIDATAVLGRACSSITPTNTKNMNDYLVRRPSVVDYPNWRGPYMEPLGADPWDRGYIIHVLPLIFSEETDTDVSTGQFGQNPGGKLGFAWIVSVGPDRLLQTKFTDPQLAGNSDDNGKTLGKRVDSSAGGKSVRALSQ